MNAYLLYSFIHGKLDLVFFNDEIEKRKERREHSSKTGLELGLGDNKRKGRKESIKN